MANKISTYSNSSTLVTIVDENHMSAEAHRFKFNQLFDYNFLKTDVTINGLAVSIDKDEYKIDGTATEEYTDLLDSACPLIAGHNYYITSYCDTPDINFDIVVGTAYKAIQNGLIFTNTSDSRIDRLIVYTTKNEKYNIVCQPMLIDLTEMFGANNEPTSVQQLYQYIHENTYYPYYDISSSVNKINNINLILSHQMMNYVKTNMSTYFIWTVNDPSKTSSTDTSTDTSIDTSTDTSTDTDASTSTDTDASTNDNILTINDTDEYTINPGINTLSIFVTNDSQWYIAPDGSYHTGRITNITYTKQVPTLVISRLLHV